MAEEAAQPGLDINELVEEEKITLEEERERHRRRAEKFGVEYRDPGRSRREFRDEARRERILPHRPGFATGFDMFTEEESQKRQQRGARFNMPGTGLEWTAPEDLEIRKARAQRFGTEFEAPDPNAEAGLMDIDLYEQRKDAPAEVDRRPDAVHVYGVDLLSTGDVLSYFADYGPTYVEWLNDSSANVLFGDSDTAKRAIAGLGAPLPAEDLPQGVEASDPANMEYLWHKGADFHKAGSSIPLIFRMATVLDVKPSERVQSRRLWVGAGGRGGGGGVGEGRGRGRGRKYRARRSYEGGEEGGEGGFAAAGEGEEGNGGFVEGRPRHQGRGRGRGEGDEFGAAHPSWQHDDRYFDAPAEGEGGEGGGRKGRGSRMFGGKRRSDADGDVRGAAQRQRVADDAREVVDYGDL